ncbi:MAG: hypothetical protein PHR83_16480 [Paludibacter sp.]|nr:hypothetical protein [Paludibacter sp.]
MNTMQKKKEVNINEKTTRKVFVNVEVWYEVDLKSNMTKRKILDKLSECETLQDICDLKEVEDVYIKDEWFENIGFDPENSENIWIKD